MDIISTKAWHLRQDGTAFPVKIHIYAMGDEDLSSEAEVAAFLIKTDSKDQDLAKYVLDAWMALLIEQEISYEAETEEDVETTISTALSQLPYHFQYPLSTSQLLSIHRELKNYTDVDSLYEFVDKIRDNIEDIQEQIRISINQQFCRVRFGGQFNTVSGNNEIWFRISSTNYNWANTIYVFVASIKRAYNLSSITICRDPESDGVDEDYVYRAKDGTYYEHMPIEEYYEEEHEHSPVFEAINLNAGLLHTIKKSMRNGSTYYEVLRMLESYDINLEKDVWDSFVRNERKDNCKETKFNSDKPIRRRLYGQHK